MITFYPRHYFGFDKEDIEFLRYPDSRFDRDYNPDWFADELSLEMLEAIDKTEFVTGSIFESPFLGPIPHQNLSSGLKGLILIYKNFSPKMPRVFSSVMFGNNCAKWLVDLSYKVDFGIMYDHCIHFPETEPMNAQAYDGESITTYKEALRWYGRNH